MIEVMVVIAVMATLTSMLITSIKSGKDVAISANCMSNLSQIRNITELHRKDFGKLPYSENWLIGFSFAEFYLSGERDLSIFTCPGSEDEQLTNFSQLNSYTSYYYTRLKTTH